MSSSAYRSYGVYVLHSYVHGRDSVGWVPDTRDGARWQGHRVRRQKSHVCGFCLPHTSSVYYEVLNVMISWCYLLIWMFVFLLQGWWYFIWLCTEWHPLSVYPWWQVKDILFIAKICLKMAVIIIVLQLCVSQSVSYGLALFIQTYSIVKHYTYKAP